MLVRDVMTPNPHCVDSADAVAHAAALMARLRIRHLLVLSGGLLVGILSINDVPRNVKSQLRVFDIMTCNPITVQETDTVDRARQLMRSHGIASLPVLNGRCLVGIVTVADVS